MLFLSVVEDKVLERSSAVNDVAVQEVICAFRQGLSYIIKWEVCIQGKFELKLKVDFII